MIMFNIHREKNNDVDNIDGATTIHRKKKHEIFTSYWVKTRIDKTVRWNEMGWFVSRNELFPLRPFPSTPERRRESTMVHNRENTEKKPSNYSLSHEQGSERSDQENERSARAKRVVRSKQTSERCERMSKRTSEWPSTSVCIFGCFGPQCLRKKKTRRCSGCELRFASYLVTNKRHCFDGRNWDCDLKLGGWPTESQRKDDKLSGRVVCARERGLGIY